MKAVFPEESQSLPGEGSLHEEAKNLKGQALLGFSSQPVTMGSLFCPIIFPCNSPFFTKPKSKNSFSRVYESSSLNIPVPCETLSE
jgi:hypothetical protein